MTAFQIMKQSNCMLVLRLLREKMLSRAELSRQTGLTRATITGLTDELIEAGLIREGEITKIEKGRHPTMLGLAPDAYYSVGIDISREGITLCFLDFTMQSVFERSWSAEVSRERVLDEIVETVKEASSRYRFLGVGVVAPGPVDSVHGRILTPNGLNAWHGFCVSELEERLSLPTVLKKDTAALAIAEKSYIGSRASFLVLLADHGLGGGFIYNGRLFESVGGGGCELGHVSIDRSGPLCACGNRGCAEMFASVPSTLARARERGIDGEWSDLVFGAGGGDSDCCEILLEQARALSAVCISVVNMLEPEYIVLTGKLCEAYDFFKQQIERDLGEKCFTVSGKRVQLIASNLARNARVVSAANLVLENFFEENCNDNFGRM